MTVNECWIEKISTCKILNNVSLRPLYDMNNIYYKEIQKWKVEKRNITSQWKGNGGIFSILTLRFHLQTDRGRRRICFTEDGKATPFHHSLGFGPFRHTLLGRGGVLLQSTFCRKLLFSDHVSVDCSLVTSHQLQLSFFCFSEPSQRDDVVSHIAIVLARQGSSRVIHVCIPL